jgi:hypothetical protein
MRKRVVADALLTGRAVPYFTLALAVVVGYAVYLVMRTSPRTQPVRPLSPFEARIAPWLWTRRRDETTTALACIVAVGGAMCVAAGFLPVVTFSDRPLFRGDPLAGPSEHDPTARALSLAFGVVIGLLALRRGAGGEGNTVLVTLILATLLAIVAGLALQDYFVNRQPIAGAFAPTVSFGAGIILLPLGAVIVWGGCMADMLIGIRRTPPGPPDALR